MYFISESILWFFFTYFNAETAASSITFILLLYPHKHLFFRILLRSLFILLPSQQKILLYVFYCWAGSNIYFTYLITETAATFTLFILLLNPQQYLLYVWWVGSNICFIYFNAELVVTLILTYFVGSNICFIMHFLPASFLSVRIFLKSLNADVNVRQYPSSLKTNAIIFQLRGHCIL